MKPQDRKEARRLGARSVLTQLVAAAKNKVDVVTWLRVGGPDAEAFLHALETGGTHPWLEQWQALRATTAANRPGPDPFERNARRLIVLLTEALHRTGLNKRAARERAAKAVHGVFSATTEQIRYWQQEYPTISADDEKLIVGAIERYSDDHRHIVGWFVDLIRLAVDPTAIRSAQPHLIDN
jgi:hypothetical protein